MRHFVLVILTAVMVRHGEPVTEPT